MSHRELDTFIIGFAIGSIACLWLGYRLRVRVERWQAGRAARASKRARRDAKHIPFLSSGYGTIPAEQDARAVLKKPRRIPLERRPVSPSAKVIPIIRDPDKAPVAPIPIAHLGVPEGDPSGLAIPPSWTDGDGHEVRESVRIIRADAIAALTGAGYKRRDAEVALDSCTLVERAGGLESWVAAAFRRAASK